MVDDGDKVNVDESGTARLRRTNFLDGKGLNAGYFGGELLVIPLLLLLHEGESNDLADGVLRHWLVYRTKTNRQGN